MIIAGSMTERVHILSPESERGVYGELKIDWKDVKTVWARVVYAKGSSVITSGEEWLKHSVTVTMRDNAVMNERCRLLWDKKVYSVDSFNRTKTDGTITVVATYIDNGFEQWMEERKEDEE
jgi:head-tail adaptor